MLRIRSSDGTLRVWTVPVNAWFISILFIAAGILLWRHLTVLECEAPDASCRFVQAAGLETEEFSAGELEGARLDEDGDGTTIVLEVDGEDLELGSAGIFSGLDQRTVDRIDGFAQDGEPASLTARPPSHLLTLLFSVLGVGMLVLGRDRYRTSLDRSSGRYNVERPVRFRGGEWEGPLESVTGTFVESRRSSRRRRRRLGLLLDDASFLPISTLEKGSARKMHNAGLEICRFLELGEDNALSYTDEDVDVGVREQLKLMGRAESHAEEVDALQARLQEEPDDPDGFRDLVLRLARLERRGEAADVLRRAHARFLEQGRTRDANRMAAMIRQLDL